MEKVKDAAVEKEVAAPSKPTGMRIKKPSRTSKKKETGKRVGIRPSLNQIIQNTI